MHQQYEFSLWEGSPKRFLRTIGDAALRIRRHIPRRLWAFWNSADLPLITKACLNSWPAHFPKHTIVVVTPETIEPRRVCRRLIWFSYAAMASVSRAA